MPPSEGRGIQEAPPVGQQWLLRHWTHESQCRQFYVYGPNLAHDHTQDLKPGCSTQVHTIPQEQDTALQHTKPDQASRQTNDQLAVHGGFRPRGGSWLHLAHFETILH